MSEFVDAVMAVDSGLPWKLPRSLGEKIKVANQLMSIFQEHEGTEQELMH